MTKTIWVDTTGASTTYVPREKPIQESVAPFSGTISGAAPATTNLGTNSGQRILAADGTWIPQPAFTSGGADQLETLRPSVISPSYSANPPTVTDSAKAYDSDTNHATTFGQWYAAQEARTNNRVDIFSLTTWASKTQTWTAATINVSRSYAILQDGESASVDGLSSKTSSVKYEFSTNNGSSWTTLGTDTQSSIPTAPQTLSMALGSLTPTMGNILVKVTITRGGGGTIYEDGVSLPGLTGEIDLKLFDVWIDGTYAGGAGNITCNNLTVTGDATFQNKIYDSTASAGTTGQVLKVAANGKVTWATDSAGTGTVTSITTTGANGVTISGGSTQTITTSGTFALALGNITPTSISTGTGSFSGDVAFASSITTPSGSSAPVVIAPDGGGDLHINTDSIRFGYANSNSTLATRGTGDLILTTHEGSAVEGVIRLYDGANGNITLTPNGTGQVQVGSDQVVTLTASQTLTNKTLSSNSVWNGNVIGSAYGGAGTVNGILKANGSGTVSAASAGTDYVTSVSVTSPVSNTGTSANPTIALASGYGDTQNPYGSKTANYFLASPNGSAGVPTWRSIVAADIPTLNQNTTGTAANITATSNTTLTTLSSLVSIGTITTGTWNASAIGVAYGGTGLTTLTAGYIPYGSGTSAFGSSANLFWDSANSRLGIGTSSPRAKLETSGSIFATSRSIPTGGAGPEIWWSGTVSGISSYDRTNSAYKPLLLEAEYSYFTTANGSEQMRINNTGVGIGTASPYNKLEIEGASARLGLNNGGGASRKALLIEPLGYGGNAYARLESYDYGTSTGGVLALNVTGGNVGIGTSSPSAKLDVNGQVRAAYASGFQVDNAGTMLGKLYYSGGLILDRAASTSLFIAQNGSNQVTLDSSGNLGIGVTPSAWYPSVYTAIDVGASSCFGGYASGASGDELTFVAGNVYFNSSNTPIYKANGFATNYRQFNGVHQWFNAPSGTAGNAITFTQAMTLDGSGNLGLGTSSPRAKLDVSGDIYTAWADPASNFIGMVYVDGSSYRNGLLMTGNGRKTGIVSKSADNTGFIWFGTGSAETERMRIDSSGNVGIGGTASSGTRLYVVGSNTTSNTSIPIYANQVYGNTGVSSAALRLNLNDGAGGCYLYGYSGGAGFMHNAEYLAGTGWTARSTFASIMETTSSGFIFYLNSSLTAGNTFTPSERMRIDSSQVKATVPFIGNSGTKGFGAVTTTTSTSTPTGGSSGDHYYIY